MPVALDYCGHVFCAICLTEHLKGKAHTTCINCNMEIQPSSTSVKPASILAKVLDSVAKYTYLSLVFPCLLLHWIFVFILKLEELRSIGVCNGLVT